MGIAKEQNERLSQCQAALFKACNALPTDNEQCNLVRQLALEYMNAFNDYVVAISAEATTILDSLDPGRHDR